MKYHLHHLQYIEYNIVTDSVRECTIPVEYFQHKIQLKKIIMICHNLNVEITKDYKKQIITELLLDKLTTMFIMQCE